MTVTSKSETIFERHERLFDRQGKRSIVDGAGWFAASVLIVSTIFGSLYLLAG